MLRTNPFRLYGVSRRSLSGTLLPAQSRGRRRPGAAAGHRRRRARGGAARMGPLRLAGSGRPSRCARAPRADLTGGRARVRSRSRDAARGLRCARLAHDGRGAASSRKSLGSRTRATCEDACRSGRAPTAACSRRCSFRPRCRRWTSCSVESRTWKARSPPRSATALNVFTLHAEVEGGPLAPRFAAWLEAAATDGTADLHAA